MSTTEEEYVTTNEVTKEALWVIGLVRKFGVEQGGFFFCIVIVRVLFIWQTIKCIMS